MGADTSMVSYASEFNHQRFMPTSVMIVNDRQRQSTQSLNLGNAYSQRRPFNNLAASQELRPRQKTSGIL